ncbi:MAG: hypothetical protein CSA84_00135 [Actinomycetales bacterium]|nr:MAG: hypothetical protein CSA84_00135 [Actinomycetales bacterium]
MREVLSTDSVGERERLEYWHEVVRTVFWPLSVTIDGTSGYQASVSRDLCGALELSTVQAQPHTVRRTREQAAASPTSTVSLGLQVGGPGTLRQDGRDCRLEPGQAALFDPARPYTMVFRAPFSLAVFSLPRELVQSVCTNARTVTARVLAPDTDVSQAALSYLSCVATVSAQSGLTDVALSNGALNIATALLRDAFGSHDDAPHDETHQQAQAFIEFNLTDPSLTPARVAAACHVSLRQLYRAFDAAGQSVAGTIRQRRLDRARDLLSILPRNTPVAWVGARVGFGSAQQFTRVFREMHGLPPATWRATQETEASPS